MASMTRERGWAVSREGCGARKCQDVGSSKSLGLVLRSESEEGTSWNHYAGCLRISSTEHILADPIRLGQHTRTKLRMRGNRGARKVRRRIETGGDVPAVGSLPCKDGMWVGAGEIYSRGRALPETGSPVKVHKMRFAVRGPGGETGMGRAWGPYAETDPSRGLACRLAHWRGERVNGGRWKACVSNRGERGMSHEAQTVAVPGRWCRLRPRPAWVSPSSIQGRHAQSSARGEKAMRSCRHGMTAFRFLGKEW